MAQNGLTRRVAALEAIQGGGGACGTCTERSAITLGGTVETCPECGQAPLVFSIDIDRAAGREGDAA